MTDDSRNRQLPESTHPRTSSVRIQPDAAASSGSTAPAASAASRTARHSTEAAESARLQTRTARYRARRDLERAVRAGRISHGSAVVAAKPAKRRLGPAIALTAAAALLTALGLSMALPFQGATTFAASAAEASNLATDAAATQSTSIDAAAPDISSSKVRADAAPEETQVGAITLSSVPCAVSDDGKVRYPLEAGCRIGSPFGYRTDPSYGGIAFHSGVDFDPGYGVDVLSVADGVVTQIGWYGGYGYAIQIDHPEQGISTLYGHMIDGSAKVQVGDEVKVGQKIGLVGSTGKSTGPHLHLEIHVNGTPIDPLPWLKEHVG